MTTWFEWLLTALVMLLVGLAVYEVSTWTPGVLEIFPDLWG